MADVVRTTRKEALHTAGVIVGAVVAFNALFSVGAHFYYADKPVGLQADLGSVRVAFGVLSFLVGVLSFGAALAPRPIGHGLALAMGVASIVGGIAALVKDLPPVMGTTLLVLGAILPVLTWKAWRHSRSAWSFLIAIVAVFAVVTLFGAPKVRGVLHVGLWHAMILPSLLSVCVVALVMVRGEYQTEHRA